jgi:hypothetical protein
MVVKCHSGNIDFYNISLLSFIDLSFLQLDKKSSYYYCLCKVFCNFTKLVFALFVTEKPQ